MLDFGSNYLMYMTEFKSSKYIVSFVVDILPTLIGVLVGGLLTLYITKFQVDKERKIEILIRSIDDITDTITLAISNSNECINTHTRIHQKILNNTIRGTKVDTERLLSLQNELGSYANKLKRVELVLSATVNLTLDEEKVFNDAIYKIINQLNLFTETYSEYILVLGHLYKNQAQEVYEQQKTKSIALVTKLNKGKDITRFYELNEGKLIEILVSKLSFHFRQK